MNQPLELTVMMYHYVRDPGDEAEAGSGIPGLSVRTFETQLDALSQKHTLVTWLDVRKAIEEDRSLPDSACLLTFDDGMRDHYQNVYRVLHRRGLSGLFFVMDRANANGLTLAHKIHFLLAKMTVQELHKAIWEKLNPTQRERFSQAESLYLPKYSSNSMDDRINLLKAVLQRDLSLEINTLLSDLFELHVGSESEIARNYYLGLEQIREMQAGGMHFGGHSRNHPWFDWIDPATRNGEIQSSKAWLEQFEPGPWAFAYPYGGLSSDSPELLKRHGFIAAFTTRTQVQHADQYYIGRLDGEEMTLDSDHND
jgi:peptidoglycan/xylan/chitin deacetylase (PgdA/CDA1 family)